MAVLNHRAARSPSLFKVFVAIIAMTGFWSQTATAQSVDLPGCVLVWSDEFDGTEVDLSKWTFQLGDGSEVGLPGGWGNNELQYY
jgi:hypothetical protein